MLDPVQLAYQISKMADETDERNIVDFPPDNLLEVLISSFPKEWRGVFVALDSEHLPVQAAIFWLRKKSSNEMLSEIPPNWENFIDHLVSDFPVVLKDKLFFRPKILLLPLNIQRSTLGFISQRSYSIPLETLDKLVQRLRKFSVELEGWRVTHVKILESKVNELKRSKIKGVDDESGTDNIGKDLCYTDIVTKESKSRFDELVKKNDVAKSSRTIPWFSHVLDTAKRKEGSIISDDSSYRDYKAAEQDDFDMVDLTSDVDLQSETLLHRINPGSPHNFDDSDIEIIEVTENSSKQIKTADSIDVNFRELTVPLPPEHLIIDAEDDPEHLIKEEASATNSKLSDTLQLKVSALQNLLTGQELKEGNFSDELNIFSSCSSLEMEHVCNQLELKSIEESTAISLWTQFALLPTEPSFGNAAIFATHCLLPKVQELKQTASRALFTAASLFAKKHSRSFCHGVVQGLIQESNLNTPQVDLVNKVVKDCFSRDTRIHLLELIFATKSDSQGCPFSWSEDIISIVQTVVDLKPDFSSDLFESFTGVLEQQSRHLSKSLKFAKILLAVIKTYGEHVSMHFNTFVRILEGNDTFLKKAGLSSLTKVSKS
ncbi:uncharacterized protein LOC110059520 [Orbicella faveolata]|uniref:uncharacterized protein LOC110059520 n=1 Tax=Orbicella faveolata TaxID=48498 RepID=UPI0009E2CB80|nr:uncharacterized protein LOC110059520 [Orbicella faveolata]